MGREREKETNETKPHPGFRVQGLGFRSCLHEDDAADVLNQEDSAHLDHVRGSGLVQWSE